MTALRTRRPDPSLKDRLDELYGKYNCVDSATDPIQLPRRFDDPRDREVAAFCASALAFGRVASVMQSVGRLFAAMGPSPASFVSGFDARRDGRALRSIFHRWISGDDLVALMLVLRRMTARGSIEGFFLEGFRADEPDLSTALESFSTRALETDLTEAYGKRRPRPGVAYFFSRPSSGGACKRLNLFLRWMVRSDAVDFGLWRRVPPAKLVVPLDTHVIRVGRCLNLTRYSSPGWKMAADITASLRELDPIDPVKYDFSLCHLGMANLCRSGRGAADVSCPLDGLCRPARRGARAHTAGRSRASARPSGRR